MAAVSSTSRRGRSDPLRLMTKSQAPIRHSSSNPCKTKKRKKGWMKIHCIELLIEWNLDLDGLFVIHFKIRYCGSDIHYFGNWENAYQFWLFATASWNTHTYKSDVVPDDCLSLLFIYFLLARREWGNVGGYTSPPPPIWKFLQQKNLVTVPC